MGAPIIKYKMDKISLFPNTVYKSHIDPNSYKKKEFIESCCYNYNIQPIRNEWDQESKLHHTYNDMDNDKFKNLNYDSLFGIYDNLIREALDSNKFCGNFDFQWKIVNTTVNTEYMRLHDHFQVTQNNCTLFSCVHFVSFDPNCHSSTSFINPLSFASLDSNLGVSKILDANYSDNSNFFPAFEFNIKEDDFIIFPSYLKHCVNPNKKKTDYPRITNVINIQVNY